MSHDINISMLTNVIFVGNAHARERLPENRRAPESGVRHAKASEACERINFGTRFPNSTLISPNSQTGNNPLIDFLRLIFDDGLINPRHRIR